MKKMKTYTANVIIETLTIHAMDEQDAEMKYSAWHMMEPCTCGNDVRTCGHVEHVEEIWHTMDLENSHDHIAENKIKTKGDKK